MWSAWTTPTAFNEKNVGERLRNLLAPAEVADTVKRTPLSVDHGGSTFRVLVVTVPPWPHGPVGWKSEMDVQKATFRFPKRFGAHTRYMGLEEIMRTNDGRKRATFLSLRQLFEELAGNGEPREVDFRLHSGVSAKDFNFESVAADAPDGVILAVEPDLLRVRLHARPLVRVFGQQGGVPHIQNEEIPPRDLAIPIELVLSAWRPAPTSRVAALALNVPLSWDGERWRFNFTKSWGGA